MQILQINPKLKKQTTSQKNSIEIQLQHAQIQIKILKEQNKLLMNRIAQFQKQQQLFNYLQEELQYRKQQQQKMQEIIINYQDITMKLAQKINIIQHQGNQIHKESAATTIDLLPNHHEQFQMEITNLQNFRASCTKRTNRSQSFDKHKENHAITPKSRVKIDLCNLFEDKLPIKKKVFF